MRVFAAHKPLSYRVVAEVAAAGAMLHVEGLDEKNMSKMTSRSAATMHDQQNHLIQRTCAREAIGHSPKIVQWDEGSKRKKAWVAAAMVAPGSATKAGSANAARRLRRGGAGRISTFSPWQAVTRRRAARISRRPLCILDRLLVWIEYK